MAIDEE